MPITDIRVLIGGDLVFIAPSGIINVETHDITVPAGGGAQILGSGPVNGVPMHITYHRNDFPESGTYNHYALTPGGHVFS
jgi:hypothetical protein